MVSEWHGVVVSSLGLMVKLCQARLVMGWVTIIGRLITSVCIKAT